MSDLWQPRQTAVSASLASRRPRQRNLDSKFCRTKQIGMIRASRRTLVPYLSYRSESGSITEPEGAGEWNKTGNIHQDICSVNAWGWRRRGMRLRRHGKERQRHHSGRSLSGRRSDVLRGSECPVTEVARETVKLAAGDTIYAATEKLPNAMLTTDRVFFTG